MFSFSAFLAMSHKIQFSKYVYEALLLIRCPQHWLLTATPTPLATMMQLTLGYEETPLCKLPHGSMLSWFVRTRCRRDPPYLCLPVPPLHIHMRPVTLLWQETSVLHSFTMRGDLQSAIRLSSFFYFTQEQIRRGEMDEALPGAKLKLSAHWRKGLQITVANSWPNYRRNKGPFKGLMRDP